MTDVFDKSKRSQIMSRVRQKDTAPEMRVRRALHAMGYRYRLHVRSLPGTPDIVLPRHHRVVLVHGCYWHGHENCSRGKLPTSNTEFWSRKVTSNRDRDARVVAALVRNGWQVLVVWGCETRDAVALEQRLRHFMAITESGTLDVDLNEKESSGVPAGPRG